MGDTAELETLNYRLTNIEGKITEHVRNNIGTSETGAFYGDGNRNAFTGSTYECSGTGGMNFNASRSNKIYGASEHVTPINYTIRIWKRTA